MRAGGRIEAHITVPWTWSATFSDMRTALVTVRPGTWSVEWTAEEIRRALAADAADHDPGDEDRS